MAATPATLDDPGTACHFASRDCTQAMSGHGGFDLHHEHPLSLGGPADGVELALCPNHHRRQHALIRYLVETADPAWTVIDHFTPAERDLATGAVAAWRAAGSPTIDGWPCPAARDTTSGA